MPRVEDEVEQRLMQALATPGEVVSLSGPSKSGKTVLIEKIAGRENLITLTGASIGSASDVWEKTLDWMETPSSQTSHNSTSHSIGPSATIGGKASVPWLAGINASVTLGGSRQTADSTSSTIMRHGMEQVIREIGNSSYIFL